MGRGEQEEGGRMERAAEQGRAGCWGDGSRLGPFPEVALLAELAPPPTPTLHHDHDEDDARQLNLSTYHFCQLQVGTDSSAS